MVERNYTNPYDKGRFGFSASGKYNAPYKFERIIAASFAAAALAALIFIIFVTVEMVRGDASGFLPGFIMVSAAGAVAAIAGGLVVIAAAAVIIKIVMHGFSCSYLADEEKFTANIGGTVHTIYYNGVQSVRFVPRMFRSKVRGYTVKVKVNGAEEVFGIVSDSFISESATPFYIIKERAELIRVQRERERQLGGIFDTGNDQTGALKIKSNAENMEHMLGKDAEMPAVGLSGKTFRG